MEIKNCSIISTRFVKDYFSVYEGFYEKQTNANIFEYDLEKFRLASLNDVIQNILIPSDIANPIEIIDCFLGLNKKLYLVLPAHYEQISIKNSIYLEYDVEDLHQFLDKKASSKMFFITGKPQSGKSYFVNILNIYLVSKGFQSYYFSAIYRLASDIDIINNINQDFLGKDSTGIVTKIQYGYFQEKYQKEYAGNILAVAAKNPVVLIFDNFDLLSKNVQNLILSIYRIIMLNPGNNEVIFCFTTLNGTYTVLVDEELSKNCFRRKMPAVTFYELRNLAKKVDVISNLKDETLNDELLKHLYSITSANLSHIQFVLSKVHTKQIAWNSTFLSKSIESIYSETLAYLDQLDLEILSIFKKIKIPLSLQALQYIYRHSTKNETTFDNIYNSINKLEDLNFIALVLHEKQLYYYFAYREMMDYVPEPIAEDKIFEYLGDYYNSRNERIENILFCYIQSKNIVKSYDSLMKFIEIYKKYYDYEPVIYYIDKVLQTFKLSNDQRFDLLYEKAEILANMSMWFESLTMLYELLPYSRNIDDIYYYICQNYYYLGDYGSFEEFIQAYSNQINSNKKLKLKINFIEAPILCIKGDRDKATNLLKELGKTIKNEKFEKKNELLKEYYICCANCYFILNEVALAKEYLYKAHIDQDDIFNVHQLLDIYLLQSKFAIYENLYNMSLSWANKGLTLCDQFYNLRYISDFDFIIGLNLYHLKNYSGSLVYLKKASKIKEELNHKFDLALIRYYEALVLYNIGNFSQAISKVFKAAYIFKTLDAKVFYKLSQLLLVKCEFEMRNYERAFYILRQIAKEFELTAIEKEELIYYVTKIQQTINSMNETIDLIRQTGDFTKIPSYFHSLRNVRTINEDLSLKLLYSLQHLVDQNPHFEKVYEEIIIYLTNFMNADISFLVTLNQEKGFQIIKKYSPVGMSSYSFKGTIAEILKLAIIYEEKVTTMTYDSETILCIPLYRLSRLPPARSKKLSVRIRKNYLGFIFLFFSNEPQSESILSISNSYGIINSTVTNSLEYKYLSREDDYSYRFKVFKEIVSREIYNCKIDFHPYCFGYLKIIVPSDSNISGVRINSTLDKFSSYLAKYFRSEDLVTRLSESEFLIFLPFAEKFGENSLKNKFAETLKCINNEINLKNPGIINISCLYALEFYEPSEQGTDFSESKIERIIEHLKGNARELIP
ncbi:MAG: hypothetical protein GX435_06840 [Exilispira sp.]|nr:hypothetical protein [Exilispira sp.]